MLRPQYGARIMKLLEGILLLELCPYTSSSVHLWQIIAIMLRPHMVLNYEFIGRNKLLYQEVLPYA